MAPLKYLSLVPAQQGWRGGELMVGGEGGAVFSVQGSYRAKRGAHRTGQLGGGETGALGEPCL